MDSALAQLNKLTDKVPGVVTIGIDDDNKILYVYVTYRVSGKDLQSIPDSIGEYKIVIRRSGKIRPARDAS
jgi:multisubunit Na+/H+ antiporter MnhE subunit